MKRINYPDIERIKKQIADLAEANGFFVLDFDVVLPFKLGPIEMFGPERAMSRRVEDAIDIKIVLGVKSDV